MTIGTVQLAHHAREDSSLTKPAGYSVLVGPCAPSATRVATRVANDAAWTVLVAGKFTSSGKQF